MRYFISIIFFLLIAFRLHAQEFPNPMVPLRLVNDYTGLLSEQEQINLNNKLLSFNNETSTQIYVITYDDLQGYDIGDFGQRLAQKWGIGQQGKNNGILMLVSPESRKITIQTGYGMEGAVPDAIASRLISEVITPSFRQAEYYAGLDSATNVLMSLTRGEFTADQYMKKKEESGPGILFALFILFMFIILITSSSRRKNRYYSPGRSLPWWLLLGSMGAGKNSGWGSFTSGRGSFGGGGGGFGGFGGGGGGSFGGGGASGGW